MYQYIVDGSRFHSDVAQTQFLGSLIPDSGAHLAKQGSKTLLTRPSGVFPIMSAIPGLISLTLDGDAASA